MSRDFGGLQQLDASTGGLIVEPICRCCKLFSAHCRMSACTTDVRPQCLAACRIQGCRYQLGSYLEGPQGMPSSAARGSHLHLSCLLPPHCLHKMRIKCRFVVLVTFCVSVAILFDPAFSNRWCTAQSAA